MDIIAKELLKVAALIYQEPPGFGESLKGFVEYCQKTIDDHMKQNFPNLTVEQLSIMLGQRYARIVRSGPGTRSVFCFVDRSNGDILKAASWATPAKHARGNIFKQETWKYMTPYGAAYLR